MAEASQDCKGGLPCVIAPPPLLFLFPRSLRVAKARNYSIIRRETQASGPCGSPPPKLPAGPATRALGTFRVHPAAATAGGCRARRGEEQFAPSPAACGCILNRTACMHCDLDLILPVLVIVFASRATTPV